jgi:hypothetical protein
LGEEYKSFSSSSPKTLPPRFLVVLYCLNITTCGMFSV